MPICRRCWEPLAPQEGDVAACPAGHGFLVQEAWLRRALPDDPMAAWDAAVRAAPPSTLACSGCGAPARRVRFASSRWGYAFLRLLPVPYFPGLAALHDAHAEETRPILETDVTVERCDRCHAAWFDAGELASLVDRGPAFPEPQPLACPRCSRPLTENSCPRHGAFVPGSAIAHGLGAQVAAVKTFLRASPGDGPACVACGAATRRLVLDGHEVEACPGCLGVWVDAEEAGFASGLAAWLASVARRGSR